MDTKKIRSALISVYSKEGLEPLILALHHFGVTLYSTGGTQEYISALGIPVLSVESLTGYPSILDGRVKTLHPKVFGGILARREPGHAGELSQFGIPEIDLVVVDLYPFEETLATTDEEAAIVEKIDIGGISLIRAAAKNFRDVVVVPSRRDYAYILSILEKNDGATGLAERKVLAGRAFEVSSRYDAAIMGYFKAGEGAAEGLFGFMGAEALRYGENPHQSAVFYGDLGQAFEKCAGKALSYNNLVDIDAAVALMAEFADGPPTFAILKHTNPCGVATRPSAGEAWEAALQADPVSAFGGILISNTPIDLATAVAVDEIFYEVLIAPDFSPEALEKLARKKNRILLRAPHFRIAPRMFKSLLHGVIGQDSDRAIEDPGTWAQPTREGASEDEKADLLFALKCVKHLKSNAIALVRGGQLIGMGCGQTSRVDALQQALSKARHHGFDPAGAVLASDAFFPFPDCVAIAHEAGIRALVQPGGSVRDQESIDCCDARGMAMLFTGIRHFKH
jgi:phosphoribosylaminoimidazolecarboxamide formyltransferase/IMP cyclohydrolase